MRRLLLVCSLGLCFTGALCGPARARYARPDLEEVPLERLLENVAAQLAKDETQVEAWRFKARLHAMAYARKEAQVQLRVGKGEAPARLWFGFEPPSVPFRQVREAKDEAEQARARAHLEAALAAYGRALKLEPKDLLTQLGLAWCQDQAGEKAAALAGYRTVFKAAWERDRQALEYSEWERKANSGEDAGPQPPAAYFGRGPRLSSEVGGYLIALLDPKEDAAELAEVKARVARVDAAPRAVTPIAIPLEADLSPAECLGGSARFDLDGSGRARRWRWINPRAAWLVYDPRGAGQITSALQLFGSRSFNLFPRDGYAALALLDDDGDGWLRGAELEGLALWRDLDGDGRSDPGEVQGLAAHGIRALSCAGETHASGIPCSPRGVELSDGSFRPSYDLVLESR